MEVTFYLVLPMLALMARRLPVRARGAGDPGCRGGEPGLGTAAHSRPGGRQSLNWPPAYASWFAAGMMLAEWTVSPIGWMHRLARATRADVGIVVVTYLISASPLAGPEGLTPATLSQFVVQDRDGSRAGLRAAGAAGPGSTRHPAPDSGISGDGDAGTLVLRLVRLAPGRAGDGISGDRQVRLQRRYAGDPDPHLDLRLRHGRRQLCAGGVTMSAGAAALGVPPKRQ